MIYTVTMNPSLDYIVELPSFKTGVVNRTSTEHLYAGGKGINVSTVLTNLGTASVALGFIAGFSGTKIVDMLQEHGVATDFINLEKGMSRINVKLSAESETEINASGPEISPLALEYLFTKFDRLTEDDMLVLAGSIPASVPATIYRDIMKRLQEQGTKVIVDATKDLLTNVLEYKPFLIKPNNHELSEIIGYTLDTKEKVIAAAREIQQKGARNVLVSMAGDGAVLLDEHGTVHQSGVPNGEKINSVGAGDSMVAGFLDGYVREASYEAAFKMGVCAGSASAFSQGLARKSDIEALLHNQPFPF